MHEESSLFLFMPSEGILYYGTLVSCYFCTDIFPVWKNILLIFIFSFLLTFLFKMLVMMMINVFDDSI